jgi:hypothetical protein
MESPLRSAPVAASTLSGKRRHGAESARGAGRHFDPYGEAAPKRGVCRYKTLAAANWPKYKGTVSTHKTLH